MNLMESGVPSRNMVALYKPLHYDHRVEELKGLMAEACLYLLDTLTPYSKITI